MSEQKRTEPEADWLPLRGAVFKFGFAEDRGPGSQHKPFYERTEAEIAASIESSFSVDRVIRLLTEKSGADRVEIDTFRSTFCFGFSLSGGGAMGGTPWGILEETQHNVDPRFAAEALFNKEGLVKIGDEEAAELKKRRVPNVWNEAITKVHFWPPRALPAPRSGARPSGDQQVGDGLRAALGRSENRNRFFKVTLKAAFSGCWTKRGKAKQNQMVAEEGFEPPTHGL